jgi:hypothetical protein
MTIPVEGLDEIAADAGREFAEAMTCSDVACLRSLIGIANGRVRALMQVLRQEAAQATQDGAR